MTPARDKTADRPAAAPAGIAPWTRRWIIAGIVAAALALRVLALVSWRDQPPPPDTRSFLEQARSLITEPQKDDAGRPMSNPVAEWFHGHRKPPLFSGLIGLAVRASERVVPYTVFDEDAGWRVVEVDEQQRVGRLRLAALVFALAGGMWMLRPAWLILRRCGSEAAALAGLAFVAVVPVGVTFSAKPLSDTVYAGLFLYAVAALLDGLVDRKFDSLLTAGLLAGLAFLTRSEALLLAPVTLLLLALGAIRKRLTWRYAAGGAAAFTLTAASLCGPYIAMVSRDEGRFTIRRNAGNLLLHDIGVSPVKTVAPDQRRGEGEAIAGNLGRIARRWPGFFARNLYDDSSQMLGYVGMFFVIAGLFFRGRELLRWGPWQMPALIYLLLVAQLSIFQPHGRILLSPLALLAPLMGLGAVALVEEIIRWNPAGLPAPRRALPWIVVACVLAVAAATAVMVRSGRTGEKLPPGDAPAAVASAAVPSGRKWRDDVGRTVDRATERATGAEAGPARGGGAT